MPDLAQQAQWLARYFAPFPLAARSKEPLAGSRGVHEATRDSEQIERWFRGRQLNIGVACGEPSGIVVLDVDTGKGGIESLQALQVQHGQLATTWTVRTGTGGFHLYFAHQAIGNTVGRLGSGLDTRDTGGYVVAPPSLHPNGQPYQWVSGRCPDQCELAPLPMWIAAALHRPKPEPYAPAEYDPDRDSSYGRAVLEGECDAVRQAAPGARNATLNAAAFAVGRRVACGLIDAAQARGALIAAAIEAGLPRREALRTANSGLSAGMQQPKPRPQGESWIDRRHRELGVRL